MDLATFCDESNWTDYVEQERCYSSYYLAIPNTRRFEMPDAVRKLWTHPALTGPWHDRAAFLTPTINSFDIQLFGLITIDGYEPIGCLSIVIPDIDDWLYLEIPYRMLQHIENVQFSFIPKDNPWIRVVDALLVDIANDIFSEHAFDLALIGDWPSGLTYENGKLTIEQMDISDGGLLLSPLLWEQFQPKVEEVILSSGLHWLIRRQMPGTG